MMNMPMLMRDDLKDSADVHRKLVEYQKKNSLAALGYMAKRLLEERDSYRALLEAAAGRLCEWCREGVAPTMEPDFCTPETLWHKVYGNWIACKASPVLLPRSGASRPAGEGKP